MIPRWVSSAEMIIQSNFLDLPLEALPSPQLLHLSCIPLQQELSRVSRLQKDQPTEAWRPGPTTPSGLGGSWRCTRGEAEGQNHCDATRRAPPGSPAPGPAAWSRTAWRHPQWAQVRGFASTQARASPADSHPGDPLPSLPCCV